MEKIMKTHLLFLTWISIFFVIEIFSPTVQCQANFILNKSHLDYLYQEIKADEKQMAIIHIYSNAPDYKYVDDEDEGYACVDDAARAAIFYLEYFKAYNDSSSLQKYYNLVEFLLYMQADNGFFYNFIWKDNSINKSFKTSIAEADWWSWRALWAMIEGYDEFKKSNDNKANRIKQSIEKTVKAIKQNIPKKKEEVITTRYGSTAKVTNIKNPNQSIMR